MQYLFIAEKPSLARAIAEAIGSPKQSNGCIYCANDSVVTWCFGHLLEIVNNRDDKWKDTPLPILPNQWLKKPKDASSAKQLKIIKELTSQAKVVINAGDPDREGQLLVDEVLEYIGYKGKVLRLWVQALDKESMQKALKKLEPNEKYKPLKDSAEARSRADWLVGINLTRVYTLQSGKFVTVGRVQTPTLKLIADRDNTIANFKPKDFYDLTNTINNSIKSNLITKDLANGIDEENRLVDKNLALLIAKETSNTSGVVKSIKTEKKTVYPPMPFALSTLQKHMSAHFGFSAKQTLDTLQNLYEKKLVTYPRTDCEYLPEEQFTDAPAILNQIVNFLNVSAKPNPSIKHKAWNSSKLSAHHGIMPTKDFSASGNLNDSELLLYKEILKSYLCLFFEPYEYNQTTIIFAVKNYNFQSIIKNPIKIGFLACSGEKVPVATAVNFKEGQAVSTSQTEIETKQTTPPPRFTDGTIIEAMSHIHKYITDEKAKAILKETDGIGTEATRAAIIENLIKKGFIKRQGKNIVTVQPFVNMFLKHLPNTIQDPVLTAQWESKLSEIANMRYSLQEFEKSQRQFVAEIVSKMQSQAIDLPQQQSSTNQPYSKKPYSKQSYSKQNNKQTNSTNNKPNKQGNYKQTNKPTTPSSSPASAATCPACGASLATLTTKTGKPYYKCNACKSAFWVNNDGSVGKKWEIKLTR